MIQPNLRGCILRRATTQFEEDRMSEAHTNDDLRLKRRPKQTLVIAMPWDTRSVPSVPVQVHSRRHLPFSTPRCQKGCDPAPQLNGLCKNEGISLWQNWSTSITV